MQRHNPLLQLKRCSHGAGEYKFTPASLALSVGFSRISVEMEFDGRSVHTKTDGDIKVMPRGQERIFRHKETCNFSLICLNETHLNSAARPGVELRPYSVLSDPPLRHIIDALLAAFAMGPVDILFQEALAQAIVARLRSLDSPVPARVRRRLSPETLARVLDYLDAHISQDVSMTELARVANISPAHFSELFRNSTGHPPHRYHLRLRLQRAEALLLRGMAPAEAAAATGFYDQSHLGRHLRRSLGVSPANLRARSGA
jgi:AraC family transcriptional regulator